MQSVAMPNDPNTTPTDEKRFHGWRLLGILALVVIGLAVIAFLVDWIVIGPLEGRVL